MPEITVLKFGSSVLRSPADLPLAVHAVYRAWRGGSRVLAVTSALGATTDELLTRAEQLGLPPDAEGLAALVATGESAAAALLALSLRRSGLPTVLLDPAQAGLLTHGDPLDAEPAAVDLPRLERALATGVVVVPGFLGRDGEGRTTLLGRGGSDLTALFLAHALGGACTLVKDVDGLWTRDPADGEPRRPRARRFAAATWETARRRGGGLVQEKSLRFAAERGVAFEIASPLGGRGTRVGPGPDRLAPAHPIDSGSKSPDPCPRSSRSSRSGSPAGSSGPLRVALLGCGTVGGGVLTRLLACPDLFEVVGVAVREPARPREIALDGLLAADWRSLLTRPSDVLVELAGGCGPAREAILAALAAGRHVVTANKALLATAVDELEETAAARGVTLRYSASVGGALPALEAVRRAAAQGAVRSLRGVLNGTSSFVLDRLAGGDALPEAIAAARAAGYAEADPTLDVDGTDAAQKLALLARAAWGTPPPAGRTAVAGIGTAAAAVAARSAGRVLRLVATCEWTAAGLDARVAPVEVPADDLLAQPGPGNALHITLESGAEIALAAQGAGRWPTTEAVFADLLDIFHGRSAGARGARRRSRPAGAGPVRAGEPKSGRGDLGDPRERGSGARPGPPLAGGTRDGAPEVSA